jgi:hypothetical protein
VKVGEATGREDIERLLGGGQAFSRCAYFESGSRARLWPRTRADALDFSAQAVGEGQPKDAVADDLSSGDIWG